MPAPRFVPYDDDTMGYEDEPEIPEDPPEPPPAPYWHGVSPEDAYARYLILWNELHSRYGGTSIWKPAWRRLSLPDFGATLARYGRSTKASVRESLLVSYESLVYDPPPTGT